MIPLVVSPSRQNLLVLSALALVLQRSQEETERDEVQVEAFGSRIPKCEATRAEREEEGRRLESREEAGKQASEPHWAQRPGAAQAQVPPG